MIRPIARATQFLYKHALRPLLFRRDPERVHDQFLALGERLGASALARAALHRAYAFHHPALEQMVAGIRFSNPIGLAAGFDKNGRLTGVIPAIGFGFMEVGSVTALPCAGNPKPRLWRIPARQALLVNYGLANDGADVIAERLRAASRPRVIPIGVSVAKTNAPSTVSWKEGITDYVTGIAAIRDIADYITINVSCTNAYGGEPFTDPVALAELLTAIDALAIVQPVFLKMPSDFTDTAFDALLAVAATHRVAGVIIGNLMKTRDALGFTKAELEHLPTRGGFSGKPIEDRVNNLIGRTFVQYRDRLVIIGCGGVFTADDAYEKIRLGASLVQLITGMVYEGPSLVGKLNAGLIDRLRRDGYTTIRQAVGAAYRH